jgi:hypothetical protein
VGPAVAGGLLLVVATWAAVINAGPTTVVGINTIAATVEIVIYAIELARVPPPQEQLLRIGIVIEDLIAPDGPTGIVQADFTELRMYSSTDAILDGGDTQIGTVAQVAINIGIETDVPGGANLLPGGGSRFYLITAIIDAAAVNSHAFRVGALVNNIDIDEDPPGPGGFDGITDSTVDGILAAANANRVVISSTNLGSSGSAVGRGGVNPAQGVPFSSAWLAAIGIVFYGVRRLLSRAEV